MAAAVLNLTGCGCWPLEQTSRYESEWKSQSVAALFKNADREGDACVDALYTQHLKDAVSACNNGEYEKIRNRISGEPVRTGLAKATCEEAQVELDHGIPAKIDQRIFNLNPFPDEFSSCMTQKGFKLEQVEKKECYVKIM
ncbi:hypothetical protein ACN22W_26660 [Burkholderia theae]|uniref:hypothetical protein n=1 Tax=Burkholderia theae TaxID=3143496 RepID=UPI003AFA72AF